MGNGGGEGGGSTTGLLFRCLLGRIFPATLPTIRPISPILKPPRPTCVKHQIAMILYLVMGTHDENTQS